MGKQEVSLCELKRSRVSIHVTERLLDDGGLIISGQDLGEAVEEFWGDRDYEYWLTIPPEDTRKLFKLLRAGDQKSDPLDVLKNKFHGESAFRSIRAFCGRHGIKAKFDSYS